jgi:hypothetical protein
VFDDFKIETATEIEIDKGSLTLFEIEIETDKPVKFNVIFSSKPSRVPPNHSQETQ